MSREVMTTGAKKAGKISVRDRERFDAEVQSLRDGELIFIVRRAYATRSAAANAYYWSTVIDRLSRHIKGMNPDEVHDLMKSMFLPKKSAACDGNGRIVAEFVIGGSTTKLTDVQFRHYCNDICRWAAGEPLCLFIPLPDRNWRETERAA